MTNEFKLPKLPTIGAMSKDSVNGKLDSTRLHQIATESGLGQEADEIVNSVGESTQEIFSGGVIMDFFDTLNVLQYGIVGMLKGKSFEEGVKTRQSFSDKDALGDNGLPGVIAGIIADIVVDPMTYMPFSPVAWAIKGIGKVTGLSKGLSAFKNLFKIAHIDKVDDVITKVTPKIANTKAEKAGQWITNKILGIMGQDKVYYRAFNKTLAATADQTTLAKKLILPFAKMNDYVADVFPKLWRELPDGAMGRIPVEELSKFASGDELKGLQNIWKFIDDIQEERAQLGLPALDDYVHNMYKKIIEEGGASGYGSKANQLLTKGRKLVYETPEEVAKAQEKAVNQYLKQNGKEIKALSEYIKGGGEVAEKGLFEATSKTGGLADGMRVTSADRGNIGNIVKAGEKRSAVLFTNKKTGLSSTVEIANEKLTPVGKKSFPKKFSKPRNVESARKRLENIGEGAKKVSDDIFAKAEKNKEAVRALRAELGEIDNSLRPLAETMVRAVRDTENFKFLKALSDTHGIVDDVVQPGYAKITGKAWGPLEGKQVPEYLYEALNETMEPKSGVGKVAQKAWGLFKWGKTAGNPAGHVRNVMSNKVLNWWKLGMNPLDPRAVKSNIKALGEIKKGTGKYINEVRKLGWNPNTFAGSELMGLFDGAMINPVAKGLTGKVKNAMKGSMKKMTDLYQFSENEAKLSGYIFNRSVKKMGIEEAWDKAMAATFDYNAVGPYVRKLRQNILGVPFLTFGIKAAPLVAETAVKAPARISFFGKMKKAIANLSDIEETERESKAQPPWVTDGLYYKIPMKDEQGRSMWFDASYIIPIGDLASGQFFERQIDRETGLPESEASAMLRKAPIFNLLREISKNQDFYGAQIWKNSDTFAERTADLTRHIAKMWLPPIVAETLPGGHISKGRKSGQRKPTNLQRIFGDVKGTQQRNATQEGLRHLGIKIQPVDVDVQESYAEMGKKKALETLLIENGALGEYTRTYQPKK